METFIKWWICVFFNYLSEQKKKFDKKEKIIVFKRKKENQIFFLVFRVLQNFFLRLLKKKTMNEKCDFENCTWMLKFVLYLRVDTIFSILNSKIFLNWFFQLFDYYYYYGLKFIKNCFCESFSEGKKLN